MKLFKDSRGFIISFGYSVAGQQEQPNRICWNDPATGQWAPGTGEAGWNDMRRVIAPEFVRECNGQIIAYQPGCCIEMTYIGAPIVWAFRMLEPA